MVPQVDAALVTQRWVLGVLFLLALDSSWGLSEGTREEIPPRKGVVLEISAAMLQHPPSQAAEFHHRQTFSPCTVAEPHCVWQPLPLDPNRVPTL